MSQNGAAENEHQPPNSVAINLDQLRDPWRLSPKPHAASSLGMSTQPDACPPHMLTAHAGYAQAVSTGQPDPSVASSMQAGTLRAGPGEPEAQPAETMTGAPPPHPPVQTRMLPQWETRHKRKAKAYATRENQRSPSPSDSEDGLASSPCPPPRPSNTTSKRKRVERDVGLDPSRLGTTTVMREEPVSAPTRETYNWMTHQATPGPSGALRGDTPPYDLRRDAPAISAPPSLRGAFEEGRGMYPSLTQPPTAPQTQLGTIQPLATKHAQLNSLPPWASFTAADDRMLRDPPHPTHLHPSSSYNLPHAPAPLQSEPWANDHAYQPAPVPPPVPATWLPSRPQTGVPPNAPLLSRALPSSHAGTPALERQNDAHFFGHNAPQTPQRTSGGWQPMGPAYGGRPDYAAPHHNEAPHPSYAPMEVDCPETPMHDMFNVPRRTHAAAQPPLYHGPETTRRATPFPRSMSARPLPRPPTAPFFAPNPRYPPPPPPFMQPRHFAPCQPSEGADAPDAPPQTPMFRAPPRQRQAAPDSPEPMMEDPHDNFVMARKPEGGWPEIHGNKPSWQYDNVDPDMATSWEERDFAKCLVATAGKGACGPDEHKHRTAQETTVRAAFGGKPCIIQVHAAVTKKKRNDFPICNMLQMGSQAEIDRILEAKCISMKGGLTLFFFPTRPNFPTFMVIYYRPEALGATGRHLVPVLHERLRRAIHYDRYRDVFQRELKKKKQNDVTAEELTDRMILSVTAKEMIRVRRGTETPLVAIYCDVPTTEEDTWLAVREIFRTARLGTEITGHPTPYTEPLKCGTCHGVDHDTGMCEFPQLEEWFGPTKDSKRRDEDDDNDDDDAQPRPHGKRGFKGRGRGGGASRGGYARRGGHR